MDVLLTDVTGTNPVPPAATIKFVSAGGAFVDSGLIGPDGNFTSSAIEPGQQYVATISGEQVVPTSFGGGSFSTTFMANADGSTTTVVFADYDSPWRSLDGMALEMRSRRRDGRGSWTRGTVGQSDSAPGDTPVATAIGYAAAAELESLDQQARTVLSATRFGSAMFGGDLLDGYCADYLGKYGLRLPYETTPQYVNRMSCFLFRNRVTIFAIQRYVNAYLYSVSLDPTLNTALGEDVSGGEDTAGAEDVVPSQSGAPVGLAGIAIADDTAGGEDTEGGEDVASPPSSQPVARVFDTRTDPATSAIIPNVNPDGTTGIQPGQICIYFDYPGYAESPVVTAPYAQTLQRDLSDAFVAAGVQIIWATNRSSTTE